jgi:hypothetical protein
MSAATNDAKGLSDLEIESTHADNTITLVREMAIPTTVTFLTIERANWPVEKAAEQHRGVRALQRHAGLTFKDRRRMSRDARNQIAAGCALPADEAPFWYSRCWQIRR